MINLAWGVSSDIEIDGIEYPLNLEYSNVLRWFEVFDDNDESDDFKVYSCLVTIGNLTDEDIETMTYREIELFYVAIVQRLVSKFGKQESGSDLGGNPLEPTEKYYDLFEDGGYIFASFMHQYAMDLTAVNLHWDKFNAMIDGLSESTRFREVIKIRQMSIPEGATQEERDSILEAKKSVALRSNREAMEFEAMDLKQQREWYAKIQKGRGV